MKPCKASHHAVHHCNSRYLSIESVALCSSVQLCKGEGWFVDADSIHCTFSCICAVVNACTITVIHCHSSLLGLQSGFFHLAIQPGSRACSLVSLCSRCTRAVSHHHSYLHHPVFVVAFAPVKFQVCLSFGVISSWSQNEMIPVIFGWRSCADLSVEC